MALCMAVWSTCKNCYCVNCPQFGPYASVHYGGKYSQKKSLTVEWILMLTQKQRPVISAGIKSKGGAVGVWVASRYNLFQPLCLTNLKVGFKRTEDYWQESCEGARGPEHSI